MIHMNGFATMSHFLHPTPYPRPSRGGEKMAKLDVHGRLAPMNIQFRQYAPLPGKGRGATMGEAHRWGDG